jgi:hypothetical protein
MHWRVVAYQEADDEVQVQADRIAQLEEENERLRRQIQRVPADEPRTPCTLPRHAVYPRFMLGGLNAAAEPFNLCPSSD